MVPTWVFLVAFFAALAFCVWYSYFVTMRLCRKLCGQMDTIGASLDRLIAKMDSLLEKLDAGIARIKGEPPASGNGAG